MTVIKGRTPADTRPREMHVYEDTGDLMLSTEHPSSGNGWAIRLKDPDEIRKLIVELTTHITAGSPIATHEPREEG